MKTATDGAGAVIGADGWLVMTPPRGSAFTTGVQADPYSNPYPNPNPNHNPNPNPNPNPNNPNPKPNQVPAAGRAAFFSSGWEAIHGIAEVERGERWAMTAVFTLGAPDPAAASPGSEAFRHCTHPSDPMSYSFCRAGWSTLFGYSLGPSAGS